MQRRIQNIFKHLSEAFAKINDFQRLTISLKSSILDVRQGSEDVYRHLHPALRDKLIFNPLNASVSVI